MSWLWSFFFSKFLIFRICDLRLPPPILFLLVKNFEPRFRIPRKIVPLFPRSRPGTLFFNPKIGPLPPRVLPLSRFLILKVH